MPEVFRSPFWGPPGRRSSGLPATARGLSLGLALALILMFGHTCHHRRQGSRRPRLTGTDSVLVGAVAALSTVFSRCSPGIWPGYDLSRIPYLVYVPDRMVLYVNPPGGVPGFGPYPPTWPPLGTQALVHMGGYAGLSGQFDFNFQIDSVRTFAMGLPNRITFSGQDPVLVLFRSTVHEGFHQYQTDHFGEIPWAREEEYPILDEENSALASLELLLLKDAIDASKAGARSAVRELLKRFVAVRDYRWRRAEAYLRRYERGQEIREGSARYVEMKAVECLSMLIEEGAWKPPGRLGDVLRGFSLPAAMGQTLSEVMSGVVVPPGNMMRNRIYPMGAALGYLLDELGVDWRGEFERAGPDAAFASLLSDELGMDSTGFHAYLEEAKVRYDYRGIAARARELAGEYRVAYRKAMAEFIGQGGYRVEIEVPSEGLTSFRSTRARRWVMDRGAESLCLDYALYSLSSALQDGINLRISNAAVLERRQAGNKRTVVFYSPVKPELRVDGARRPMEVEGRLAFSKLRLEAGGSSFESKRPGKLSIQGMTVRIEIDSSPRKR